MYFAAVPPFMLKLPHVSVVVSVRPATLDLLDVTVPGVGAAFVVSVSDAEAVSDPFVAVTRTVTVALVTVASTTAFADLPEPIVVCDG
jgi:hypothetical protein